MKPCPNITDRALLRWMQRVHGVDVAAWRAIMRVELQDALDAAGRQRAQSGPAFVIAADGSSVVTFLGMGQEVSPYGNGIAIARVETS